MNTRKAVLNKTELSILGSITDPKVRAVAEAERLSTKQKSIDAAGVRSKEYFERLASKRNAPLEFTIGEFKGQQYVYITTGTARNAVFTVEYARSLVKNINELSQLIRPIPSDK